MRGIVAVGIVVVVIVVVVDIHVVRPEGQTEAPSRRLLVCLTRRVLASGLFRGLFSGLDLLSSTKHLSSWLMI